MTFPDTFRLLICGAIVTISPGALAQTDRHRPDDLIAAVEHGEIERLQWLLETVKPDVTNAAGESALMLAAKAGSFEMCRALLWAGANANLKDKAGKTARDHLKRNVTGFSSVNLLLRAYAFAQLHKTPAPKIKRPHLVMINDNFIDHEHPALKTNYWVNQTELKGKTGVDDDDNGFVDDVYGWNAPEDEPQSAPMMADLADEIDATTLKKFVTLHNRSKSAHPMEEDTGWPGQSFDDLDSTYENPLTRRLGFDNLRDVGINLDDKKFTQMLVQASHGTHVAGIVLQTSDHRALLHGITWGRFHTPSNNVDEMLELARELAPRTVSYEQFLVQLRSGLVSDAVTIGKRNSTYLRSVGAGIVNMSWSKSKSGFINVAQSMKRIYEQSGMDPKSIEQYFCPVGLDLCGDLGLEMLVAATAETALLIHENPDVLFVIAAGNNAMNNDLELPSPAYLSRFFPNVITVASVGSQDQLSSFSNYGSSSVQVAALGEEIRSTLLASQNGLMSGTSMAAPAVAGLAARIRAAHPHLTASDLRLIIERSVKSVDSLENKVSSGGVISVKEALELAEEWEPGSRGDLMLSAFSNSRLGTSDENVDIAASETPEQHFPGEIATAATDKGLRISTIAGFSNDWRVIMSNGTGYTAQVVHPHGKLPLDWIRDKWKEKWEITSIGGESTDWRVVMSQGKGRPQKLVGMDLDQTSINQFMERGYRITSVAGYQKSWVFVLTDKTSLGEQRYSLPGEFDDEREKWIDDSAAEGFLITGLAGDLSVNAKTSDSWVFVLTKNSGLTDQEVTGPGRWPTSWISEHEEQGYRITQASGYGDHWIVVMSKGTPLNDQQVSPGGAWKDDWIEAKWK